jgi:hypothetical protein
VAGTIGAVGGNGKGVAGVVWNVKLLGAKFLGKRGGTTANAIKAVDYFTDLKTDQGLNIVATNNSWGGGSYSRHFYLKLPLEEQTKPESSLSLLPETAEPITTLRPVILPAIMYPTSSLLPPSPQPEPCQVSRSMARLLLTSVPLAPESGLPFLYLPKGK